MNIEDILLEAKRWGGKSYGNISQDVAVIEFPNSHQTSSFKDWCDNNGVNFSSNNSHMVIVGDDDIEWLC